ncbi:MAG: peptidoglycan-binding domain-containing protein, partial [Brevundimonas sp.]|nr:peptidoglycan-binding domain-containing protein [Brevundimonas sp.]
AHNPAHQPNLLRALTNLGFDTQGVDGVIGANTRAALRRWQIANNRLADGYLTADLADELIRRGG